MIANDVSLRNLIPAELAKGFGFFQSKPATAFSPVAVTLDELGDAWEQGRLHLTLQSTWNGRKVGMCEAGPEMTFHFGQLIAHICKTRNVRAGSIVGSGTVSNKGVPGANGKTEWPKGYSCIAEKRAIETIQDGKPVDRIHEVRRHDPHRDERQGRAEHLRRDRPEDRAAEGLTGRRPDRPGAGMSDPYDLARFVSAQAPVYDQVVAELRAGRKRSHWMWFVFPQLAGLGHSAMAQRYAIGSLARGAGLPGASGSGSRACANAAGWCWLRRTAMSTRSSAPPTISSSIRR